MQPMKYDTDPSFWDHYHGLPAEARSAARKEFALWVESPFHPSLHFKCVDKGERIWSLRVTRRHRALAAETEGTMTWYWIGSHDAYERMIE